MFNQLSIIMFHTLTKKLSTIFKGLDYQQVQMKDIHAALDQVEDAFIESDVALEAIDQFKQHALSQLTDINEIPKGSAQSHLMKIIRSSLVDQLSNPAEPFRLKNGQLKIVMMVGLQGAGKTTTTAKLAKQILKDHPKAKILMSSVDVYRPAAITQLQKLATQIGTDFHPHQDGIKPIDICHHAVDHAKRMGADVLMIDTAGRLEIDEERMQEIRDIHRTIKPHHCYFVIDSMMGQSALPIAKTFNDTVDISGIILTKVDSDTKGGVALSTKTVINKPIVWCGLGEDMDKLEPFNPERIADQILDMGDLIGLTNLSKKFDPKQAQRFTRGEFTFVDLLSQIQQLNKIGMVPLLKMLPGAAQIPDHMIKMLEDNTQLKSIEALIQSMTPVERNHPELVINHKKRQMRIIKGSGQNKLAMKQLISSFTKMKKMSSKLKGGKMKSMMEAMFKKQDDLS